MSFLLLPTIPGLYWVDGDSIYSNHDGGNKPFDVYNFDSPLCSLMAIFDVIIEIDDFAVSDGNVILCFLLWIHLDGGPHLRRSNSECRNEKIDRLGPCEA